MTNLPVNMSQQALEKPHINRPKAIVNSLLDNYVDKAYKNKNLKEIAGNSIQMALTKIDMVNLLYENLGLPKKNCVSIVDSVFEVMQGGLTAGNDMMVSGFGKLSVI